MLAGTYQHSIDPKGRLIFPVKLKEALGESFVVCKGVEKCLLVYSHIEWAELEARMKTLPFSKARDIQRFFFSSACELSVDKQGRLLIPQHLREYAGLSGDAVVIGAQTRAEIWDGGAWGRYNETVDEKDIISMMDELGF